MSQQINLFNPLFQKQRKFFTASAMGQALLVLLAGTMIVSYMGSSSVAALQGQATAGAARLAREQARLEQANADFAPRQKSTELAAQVAQAESRLAALHDALHMLDAGELGNTRGYSEYFRAFARQNMSGLWLTGLSIEGAGNEIGVHGRALDPTLVPAYIGRLTHEPVMQGKAFGSLRIGQAEIKKGDTSGPAPYVEFSLQSGGREAGQ